MPTHVHHHHPHHHHPHDNHPSARVPPSILRLSVPARLVAAVALIAAIWGTVLWAML